MADEKEKPAVPQDKPLNDTQKMHKFALDQIAHFKKVNKQEREHKLALAKKEAEEIRAKAAKKGTAPIPPGEGDKPQAPEASKPEPPAIA